MNYSRFTKDSDVYVYDAHKGHIVIFVARHRRTPRKVEINLGSDSQLFTFDSKAKCAKKLIELKTTGYRVPEEVIILLSENRDD